MSEKIQYVVYYTAAFKGGQQVGFVSITRYTDIAAGKDVEAINEVVGRHVMTKDASITGVCITGISRLPI